MTELPAHAPELGERILFLRGQRVMLDVDLAQAYGVETRVFNQAVKRNLAGIPLDFMFQLSEQEKTEVITICDHLAQAPSTENRPIGFTANLNEKTRKR